MSHIESISLYYYSGPKALVLPYSESSKLFRHVHNEHLKLATKTLRDGGCRIKFQATNTAWSNHHGFGVQSRRILMDLIIAMQTEGKQLLCCADLNIRGASAGTFFFQNITDTTATSMIMPEQPQPEIACLQLGHIDKIRIIQLPKSEVKGLANTIVQNWRKGDAGVTLLASNKYGGMGYKLVGHPWAASETSNMTNIGAHKLLIEILRYMDTNGWNRVVPFDCAVSSRDADSLLFFRYPQQKQLTNENDKKEFCAISLERSHKLRLIGGGAASLDEMSLAAFENAVRKHTKVTACIKFGQDNLQIKCADRHTWQPHTTAQNIRSARLMCSVLQGLWDLGWRWHCAIDMSVSVADKSSFFLSRCRDHDDHRAGERIGCLQPKGQGKINLVSFPPSILKRIIGTIQNKTKWCVPVQRIEMHGTDTATVHFQYHHLHYGYRTNEKAVTANVYTKLLTIIGTSSSDITMLGSADISGNFNSGGENSDAKALDTDVFFFSFPQSSS